MVVRTVELPEHRISAYIKNRKEVVLCVEIIQKLAVLDVQGSQLVVVALDSLDFRA